MNKWIKMAEQLFGLIETQIELQQTTNRLLAKLLDQQSLAESRLLAMQDMKR